MVSRTGIGAGIGIPFKNNALGGNKPYLPPEIKDSLKAVVIAYGKSNNDSDRAIVKNLVDASNPFVISNAAFKLNSGFGKYGEDFTNLIYNNNAEVSANIIKTTSSFTSGYLIMAFAPEQYIDAIKVKITGIPKNNYLRWDYLKSQDDSSYSTIRIVKDGIYDLPANAHANTHCVIGLRTEEKADWTNLVVEQLPYFEGAFVTDGIDDLITSTKTVQEMGITEACTVISMIHQITGSSISNNHGFTNSLPIDGLDSIPVRNQVIDLGKTGIYGYTYDNGNISVVNNILGDKSDYLAAQSGSHQHTDKFGVLKEGFLTQIAWYWTIIANKVLTTDQINQVIAYFNLDRTLNPDILCNTIKQGITNENHAEFGDKLIDYSGNGRDIQLNNIAWKGDSGIGKYETDFTKWLLDQVVDITIKYSSFNIKTKNDSRVNSWVVRAQDTVIPSMKVKVTGMSSSVESLIYRYSVIDNKDYYIDITSDGIYELPQTNGEGWEGFRIIGKNFNISVEQIPSHAGALCLDGINDFGKVTGMPVYKDYTAIVCREFISDKTAPILSKAKEPNNGAFVMEIIANPNLGNTALYSFGKDTPNIDIIQSKSISYQTKYIYNSKNIVPGNGVDSDTMWIGKLRDNHAWFANAAIYSLMTFPYSMSEFLIERQLKKYKLGTLYPDMVELRPIFPKDDRIESVGYYAGLVGAKIGSYYPITTNLGVGVKMVKPYKITALKMNGARGVYNGANGFNFRLGSKSPQRFTNLNIEVDTSLVQFNPILEGKTELIKEIKWFSNSWSKRIYPGDYITRGVDVTATILLNDNTSELTNAIYGVEYTEVRKQANWSETNNLWDLIVHNIGESPQKINITIDEYIRYEDIVQPYPVLLRFNDENGNEVSWGGKFRVGSTITRIGSIDDTESNLLNGLYSISGLSLNGKAVTSSTSIVEKQMVFKTTATYLLDNNEPNCILSPRLLRIPNSSYKILGYIPDISGHGNHGVIHNSAYAEGSGVNEDGSYQFDGVDDFVTIPTLSHGGKQVLMKVNWQNNNTLLYDQRVYGEAYGFAIYTSDTNHEGNPIMAYQSRSKGKTYIDGILNNHIKTTELKAITHNITITDELNNTPTSISPIIGSNSIHDSFFAQMALYDFMLFDNISTDDKIKELNEYVGIEAKVELPPYYFDTHGKTNLDEDRDYIANLGTVQDVIEVSQPAIFAEEWYDYYESFVSRSPIINQTDYSIEVKPTHMDNNFMMMLDVNCDTPLPAFRAKFTRTSNVDVSYAEIRYRYYANGKWTYIDIFGENNSAESVILDIPASEKSSISGNNTDNFPNILIEVLPADNSVRYGLSNNNFAYDKMSGYGGYEFAKFDNTAEWISTNNSDTIEAVNREGYTVTLKKVGNGTNYWHFRNTIIKSLGQDIQIGVYANKSVQIVWQLKYKLEGETDYNTLAIASPTIEGNINTYVTLPYKTEQEIADLNAVDTYYSIYFIPIDLNIDEEVTIEMLPLYDGLVYDGVTDYSECLAIPAFTDYTYIFKREFLSKTAGSASMYKGEFFANGGMAFIADYAISDGSLYGFSYRGQAKVNSLNTDKIIYGTRTSVNGSSITPETNIDTAGFTIGKFDSYRKMVFQKLILYPKTIPLLQINFLKNLMERDEIIDLNNPIFVQE